MPYNQVQYRTLLVIDPPGARRQAHHGGPAVEGAEPLLGHPLHLDAVGGPGTASTADSASARATWGSVDRPRTRLEPVGQGSRRGHDDVDDVETVRQRLVELRARTTSGSHSSSTPISRYSASLAAPVGDALA